MASVMKDDSEYQIFFEWISSTVLSFIKVPIPPNIGNATHNHLLKPQILTSTIYKSSFFKEIKLPK